MNKKTSIIATFFVFVCQLSFGQNHFFTLSNQKIELADKPYNIDLMSVLKAFGEKGKILIGHCAAGMLFDFAGVTEGKKLAVHPLAKPAITKGQATDDKSVVDGNLFTAQDEKFVWTMMPEVLKVLK